MNPFATEARSWIGTPYKHQHSTKGRGCDCLGLLRGVYRNVIGPEPEVPPAYSASWGESGPVEFMLDAANRWLDPVTIPEAHIFVFRMRRGMIAKHCGIVSGPNSMIHADGTLKSVVEAEVTEWWKEKIAGSFRFRWQTS
ncbi:MAG: Gamma-DL-glutamyl hydrolase [Firmicutes bacterium]|nr:Gamma-DL-glutamyl hydrolase [Bacillota bacterium]